MNNAEIAVVIPQNIEFSVQSDFVNALPEILSNVEEVKRWALKQTETDRALKLVSDADFDAAKKRCAEINKVITRIEDKRKEVKKAYTEPYDVFEKKLKEVTTVLTDAKNNLWGQIKESEEAIKREKDERYRDYFAHITDGMQYKPSYDKICKSEWLNKSRTDKSVYGEIDEIIEQYNREIDTIRAVGAEFTPAMLSFYLLGNTFQDTIAYSQKLKAQKEAEEARKAEAEARTAAKAEATETKAEQPTETVAQTAEPKLISVEFRVTCTAAQLADLKAFLQSNGIKYGRATRENT